MNAESIECGEPSGSTDGSGSTQSIAVEPVTTDPVATDSTTEVSTAADPVTPTPITTPIATPIATPIFTPTTFNPTTVITKKLGFSTVEPDKKFIWLVTSPYVRSNARDRPKRPFGSAVVRFSLDENGKVVFSDGFPGCYAIEPLSAKTGTDAWERDEFGRTVITTVDKSIPPAPLIPADNKSSPAEPPGPADDKSSPAESPGPADDKSSPAEPPGPADDKSTPTEPPRPADDKTTPTESPGPADNLTSSPKVPAPTDPGAETPYTTLELSLDDCTSGPFNLSIYNSSIVHTAFGSVLHPTKMTNPNTFAGEYLCHTLCSIDTSFLTRPDVEFVIKYQLEGTWLGSLMHATTVTVSICPRIRPGQTRGTKTGILSHQPLAGTSKAGRGSKTVRFVVPEPNEPATETGDTTTDETGDTTDETGDTTNDESGDSTDSDQAPIISKRRRGGRRRPRSTTIPSSSLQTGGPSPDEAFLAQLRRANAVRFESAFPYQSQSGFGGFS